MPIIVPCPGCKTRLKAPDTAIGRAFMCPKCQTKVAVAAVATPLGAPPAATPAPARSPKIKIIDKPLLSQPAPPTRLTVVGEVEPAALPPRPTTPMPRPAPAEEPYSDFEVVGNDPPPLPLPPPAPPPDDGPLDQLDEVPEELDDLEEVSEAEPARPALLAQPMVRLVKRPPPGLAYKLTTADGEQVAMAYAVPLPGAARLGTMTPIRWELREGDDEVLRATAQLRRSAAAPTVEVLGPLDEPLGTFAVAGWAELGAAVTRVERAGQPALQLVPQGSRRRLAVCGLDGRELGELVPGNGAWFVAGGMVEVRFGPALAGRAGERLLLLCLGLGVELVERQRQG